MDFYERIKNLVKDSGITIEIMLNSVFPDNDPEKLSLGSYNTLRKRGNLPRANQAARIAQYLKTTVEYLVTGEDPEGIPPHILDLARKIAGLTPQDREEIMALIDLKLARYAPKYQEITQDPAPEYAAEPDAAYRREPLHIVNDVEFLDGEIIMIPYFGNVAAGKPLDINNPREYLPFPLQALKGDPGDYFYLKIRGYSMVDAGINEGDMVVIRKAEEPIDGKIMLIRYENAATLKRIAIRNGTTYLCWENGTGEEIKVDSADYEVQGTLAWIAKPGK
jgi:SOS-response transcriptional repressor LexA